MSIDELHLWQGYSSYIDTILVDIQGNIHSFFTKTCHIQLFLMM